MTAQKQVANEYGLQLVGYEGGQSLVDEYDATNTALYESANRDNRMGSSTATWLSDWQQETSGDLLDYFADMGTYNQYGSWGSMEDLYSTSTPKYDALIDYINATPPTFDTTAPTAPTNLTASASSTTAVYLSWNASTDDTGIQGYRIFRDGTQIAHVASTTLTYDDSGLSNISHSYYVIAYDAAGNQSIKSSTAAVEWIPTISSISYGTPGSSTTTITWTTDVAATSQVDYGLTTSYGSVASNDTATTSHNITLTNLSPSTIYHFRVSSTASGGGTATSSDSYFFTSNDALDSSTNSWASAVVTAGGTVSSTQLSRVNNLVTCLKNNNLFSLADRDWLFVAGNEDQAKVDLIHDATFTKHGTITYATSTGYAGDGTTGWLDTGFVPATAGGNYATTSASFGVYVMDNRTAGSSAADMGTSDSTGANYVQIEPLIGTDKQLGYNINNAAGEYPVGVTTTQGFTIITTTDSTSTAYRDGVALSSYAQTPTGLASRSFVIGGTRVNGFQNHFSTDQIGNAFIAGGMDATQVAEWSSCHNAYMTSMGVNVY